MSHTRQSNRFDDVPVAVALMSLTSSKGKDRAVAVIADQRLMCVGVSQGDYPAELDVIAKYGVQLGLATMYCTRYPNDMTLKLIERCGLRRLVILEDPPETTKTGQHANYVNRGSLSVEYLGNPLNKIRDMVRSLEQENEAIQT